mmetsp:Transcript_39245/g.122826  ORF Transcript_39245/g.122826 Transcript_39245/m.122826 type:complete len:469 (-) Transcript_39245:90-1496(-)
MISPALSLRCAALSPTLRLLFCFLYAHHIMRASGGIPLGRLPCSLRRSPRNHTTPTHPHAPAHPTLRCALVSPSYADAEHAEDDGGGEQRGAAEAVAEDEAARHHAEHLARRHDDAEHHRAEALDGEEDEELPHAAADGEGEDVLERRRVPLQERERLRELSRAAHFQQRVHEAEGVDAEHHLVLAELVLPEADALPLRREGVEEEVAAEHDHPEGGLGHVRVAVLLDGGGAARPFLLVEHERRDAEGDDERLGVVSPRVLLALEQPAHEHRGDDLVRLEEHLRREGHVLQRRVLAPAAKHIAQARRAEDPRVLPCSAPPVQLLRRAGPAGVRHLRFHGREAPPRRRRRPAAPRRQREHQHRREHRREPVAADEEGHARKHLRLARIADPVALGRDALLEEAPAHVGKLQPERAAQQQRGVAGVVLRKRRRLHLGDSLQRSGGLQIAERGLRGQSIRRPQPPVDPAAI